MSRTKAERLTSRMVKVSSIALCMALFLAAAVTGTLAWLTSNPGAVNNTFTVGSVGVEVEEEWDGATKSNVVVTNTGDIPAYIRAAIVVYFEDDAGNVVGIAPQLGTDYTLSLATDDDPNPSNWLEGADGFYYYKLPVDPDTSTDVLIKSATQLTDGDEYHLVIHVLASAIQSLPANAVEESWGVTIENGVLTPGTGGQG
ncbi:MAG: hypothetical protein Q4B99_00705 [Clostridia bacterium]|nr:hypothetical protein [Clostridia bacterium]